MNDLIYASYVQKKKILEERLLNVLMIDSCDTSMIRNIELQIQSYDEKIQDMLHKKELSINW